MKTHKIITILKMLWEKLSKRADATGDHIDLWESSWYWQCINDIKEIVQEDKFLEMYDILEFIHSNFWVYRPWNYNVNYDDFMEAMKEYIMKWENILKKIDNRNWF